MRVGELTLTPAQLQDLLLGWQLRVLQAAQSRDDKQFYTNLLPTCLIAQLPAGQAALVTPLNQLVENFQLPTLVALCYPQASPARS